MGFHEKWGYLCFSIGKFLFFFNWPLLSFFLYLWLSIGWRFRCNIFTLFIFNWRIIALQYCVGFCHTLTWISHRYAYVPPLLILPPTSHFIPPSRLSQSTGLNSRHHTVISHRLSILHMAMYILPFYSLNLSYLLLPALCPKVCSLCMRLHCCHAHRLISTIFLDSIYIYMLIYDICFSFLTYFTLYNRL